MSLRYMVSDERALAYSSTPKLQISIVSPVETVEDLSLAYTPGIAAVSRHVAEHPDELAGYSFVRNSLAVISDGSAVLGLGNIGHKASYPVMEGKAMLFKRFANIDAIPIVVSTQDPNEFIETVVRIADSFAAINLEDIAAPQCFAIEDELKRRLIMPLMHDDQHGTAIVVLAAVFNALKLTDRDKSARIVLSGAGAAGLAILRILYDAGFRALILCDSQGVVSDARDDLNEVKRSLLPYLAPAEGRRTLEDALAEADVFIGVSRPGLVTPAMVSSMRADPVVIAMANPVPEIMPDEAMSAGVGIIATGRSDFANQVNNALAFPGVFRGAIDAGRVPITEAMKLAAAQAIVTYHEQALARDRLLPSILDVHVHQQIAAAVAEAA